jgi:hypothetical protein
VEIRHAGGVTTLQVNQREVSDAVQGVSLGVYEFAPDSPAVVVVSNQGTDGHVVVDAVRWVRSDVGAPRTAAQ